MYVEVNDGDLQRLAFGSRPFGLHQPCGNRHIVKYAKAAAFVGVGMVRAAGHVRGQASAAQSHAGRSYRGAHRSPSALNHCLAPRKANFALQGRTKRAGGNSVDVVGRMSQRQFAVAGCWRLGQRDGR